MEETKIKKKIILTGNFGVGKTSLFHQFIYSQFSEKYLTTIGVKVDKKTVLINGREVVLMIWDIAGEITQDKIPRSYFLGASAIIYVFDVKRPSTYQYLESDLEFLSSKLPDVMVKVVGNKVDLLQEGEQPALENNIGIPVDAFTSAKTGENVEQLFSSIAKGFLVHV